jgi:hypothetical protein
LTFTFHLKFILNSNFYKMSSVRVHCSPGFSLGGGFPAEQNTHVVLCMKRIPTEQKKQFPEVLCVFRIPPEQKPDSLLPGKFPSLRKSEYHRSSSPWNTLLQRAVELRRSNLSSPPAVSYHHAGANCSAGNPPRGNPGLQCTRTDVI